MLEKFASDVPRTGLTELPYHRDFLCCRVSARQPSLLLARPEGRTLRLVGPVGHNLCVEANSSQ